MPGTIGRYCEVCVLRLCKVVWVFCGMAWILHGDIMSEMLIMYAGHGNCSGGQAIEPMPVPQTATRPRKRSDGSPPPTLVHFTFQAAISQSLTYGQEPLQVSCRKFFIACSVSVSGVRAGISAGTLPINRQNGYICNS